MSIDILREKILEIDGTIVQLLAQRMDIAKKIGEYKKKNNLPILDEKREKHIIEKIRIEAIALGLNPGFAEEIYIKIMEESRKQQE